MYFIDCSQNLRKLVTTPEPERIISFFRLRITPISYLACCTLTYIKSLNNFNFVNRMRSCHLVLMNKRKCDDDDDGRLFQQVNSTAKGTQRPKNYLSYFLVF